MGAARELLGRESPVEVFVALAPSAGARAAVAAVREALGMSRDEAERPLGFGSPEDLDPLLEAGEVRFAGELLAAHGAFDVPRVLSLRGEQARGLLREAFAVSGGIASGRAIGVIRALRAGGLGAAFTGLAAVGPRAEGDADAFWRALVAAGELLAEEGEAPSGPVREALERCRGEVGRSAGGGRDLGPG
ncbi:hypothetical protein [Streptomyces genisteinicus]|uniref:Uncharacterized protein n=1 Tax=Streptomyces genisteinicus TaxID=2768068 RepID=A0A7H0HTC6_9ACTN|nr:hypothetical protein [Streptomyces genisteinicus]QNP63792.1 hypothetical protein IAG43_13195 [Streptomyces genisteinicus]